MPNKKQVTTPEFPFGSGAEVCREALAEINYYKEKGLSNKKVLIQLSALFHMRRLGNIMDAQLLDEVREILRFVSKLPVVRDFWIDALRELLAPKEEGDDSGNRS